MDALISTLAIYTAFELRRHPAKKGETWEAPGGIFIPILNVNQTNSIRTPPAGLSCIYHTVLYHTALYHTTSPPHVQSTFSQRSTNVQSTPSHNICVQSAFSHRSTNVQSTPSHNICVQSTFNHRSASVQSTPSHNICIQSASNQRSTIVQSTPSHNICVQSTFSQRPTGVQLTFNQHSVNSTTQKRI